MYRVLISLKTKNFGDSYRKKKTQSYDFIQIGTECFDGFCSRVAFKTDISPRKPVRELSVKSAFDCCKILHFTKSALHISLKLCTKLHVTITCSGIIEKKKH